jgi:molybdopterin converting factor small subunit
MARVHLPADLSRHTGGLDVLDIDAPRVQELLDALIGRYPGLAPALGECAVAIDGEVYGEAPYRHLEPGSQVYFIPRVAGGGA